MSDTPPRVLIGDLHLDDDGLGTPMRPANGLCRAEVVVDAPGPHRVEAASGEASDVIDLFVRPVTAIPGRRLPVAPGQDCHAIGAWPAAGTDGTQLGLNGNGGPL